MENNEMSDINGTYAWTSQHSGFTVPAMGAALIGEARDGFPLAAQCCDLAAGMLIIGGTACLGFGTFTLKHLEDWSLQLLIPTSRPPGCGSRQLCVLNRPTSESMWSNLQDPNLARESTANIRPCCGEKKKPRKNENPKFRNSPQSPSKKNRTTDQWIVIFGSSQLHQFPSVLMDWTPIPSIYHFQTHPTIISCLIPIRQTHKNHTKYAYVCICMHIIYIYIMYIYMHIYIWYVYIYGMYAIIFPQNILRFVVQTHLRSPEVTWNLKSP